MADNLLIRPYLLGYSFVGGGTLKNFHETYISDMLWDKCLGMIDKHETTHKLYSNHWSIVWHKMFAGCCSQVNYAHGKNKQTQSSEEGTQNISISPTLQASYSHP